MEYRIYKLNQLVQGWSNYFKIGDIKTYAMKMDAHIRRRLRACRWKEWKKLSTKYRELKKLSIKPADAWKCANTRKGYWRLSNNPIIHQALNNLYWEDLKLKSITNLIL